MDIKESPLVSSELIFLRIFSVPNGNEYSTIIFHDRVIITPFLSRAKTWFQYLFTQGFFKIFIVWCQSNKTSRFVFLFASLGFRPPSLWSRQTSSQKYKCPIVPTYITNGVLFRYSSQRLPFTRIEMFPLPLPQSPTNARSHTLCSNVAWLLTQPLVKKIKEKCCSTASSQLSSVSQVSKKTVDSSCLESSSPRANLPYNVPTFLIPLTAVPSHFSFIQHTIRSKIIHVLPYLTPHNRFSPTCGDYRLELSIDLDSKTECHPTISLFHLQSSTEWSTYAHTPDTSRCPQTPTCKYHLRPCLYYCFRLVASSDRLLTEISSIEFPWPSVFKCRVSALSA